MALAGAPRLVLLDEPMAGLGIDESARMEGADRPGPPRSAVAADRARRRRRLPARGPGDRAGRRSRDRAAGDPWPLPPTTRRHRGLPGRDDAHGIGPLCLRPVRRRRRRHLADALVGVAIAIALAAIAAPSPAPATRCCRSADCAPTVRTTCLFGRRPRRRPRPASSACWAATGWARRRCPRRDGHRNRMPGRSCSTVRPIAPAAEPDRLARHGRRPEGRQVSRPHRRRAPTAFPSARPRRRRPLDAGPRVGVAAPPRRTPSASGNELSGGEQMLAIGRALVTNPRLLILDEANEGLAPRVRERSGRSSVKLRADGQSMDPSTSTSRGSRNWPTNPAVMEKGRIRLGGRADPPLAADRELCAAIWAPEPSGPERSEPVLSGPERVLSVSRPARCLSGAGAGA